MITKDVYETLKFYVDRIEEFNLMRRIHNVDVNKALTIVINNLNDWVTENTSLDIRHISWYIHEYEERQGRLRELEKKSVKKSTINVKKKVKRQSLKEQFKSADRKAEQRIKKWKSEPQSENWWVDKYINGNVSRTNVVKPEIDYRYILYFQMPIPSVLEEFGANKFSVRPEFYI
tara:strand:- start:151 stop:675 length:525 start_codon:yes stop_codon:yes gene_type:complete